ncbi:caspase, EACC1-associated type [Streptomyces aurantiacus]|uniref:caspase family protein n=1 Tax=Streptomyces aurantiacus TaxID=47760 RepID=UPI00099F30DE
MTLPDPHGTRAVLIGVSEYTSLHKLPAVRNNVAALREILTSSYSWNLPSRHCVTIHNPKTPEELVDPILRCVEEATDTLLVYYAGHGLKGANRGEFRLSRSTSRAGAPHTSTDYDDIREALIESTANRRIVILDCCYAASALGVMADPVDSVAEDAIVEGTYLIAASGETQAAISEDGSGFTAFTGELVRLLRDGVPDTTKKFMDLDTIFTHLRSSLRAKARPLPHRRVRNSPGGLTLAWNRQWVGWFDASHLSGEQAYRPLTSDQAAQVVASESAKALDRRPGGWPTAKTVKPSSTTSETVTPAIQQPGAWPPADTVAPPAAPEATTPAARRPGGWPKVKQPPQKATSPGVTSIDELWPRILEAVKERRRFAWILLSQYAEVTRFDGKKLELVFSNDASRQNYLSSGCDEVLEKVLREVFKVPWEVDVSKLDSRESLK